MEIDIRKATQTDLPTLLELYRVFDDPNDPRMELAAAKRIFTRIESYPDYAIYLVEREGEIIGTFALLIMDNLAHHGVCEGIVENIIVRPQFQSQGVGKEMMESAMQLCAEAGCYKLVLSSNLIRERAHRFYENLGFEKYGYSFQVDLKKQPQENTP